jgi:hypothetical protein
MNTDKYGIFLFFICVHLWLIGFEIASNKIWLAPLGRPLVFARGSFIFALVRAVPFRYCPSGSFTFGTVLF